MTKYEIVPATKEHALQLAETMRREDVEEAWAGWHKTPLQALEASLEYTIHPWAALADGRVVCMYGAAQSSVLSFRGFPWLLGSEELPVHFRAFLRGNVKYVSSLKKEFDILENYVDARNTQAIRWLKWLGFELEPEAPYGPEKLDFHKFFMKGTT